MSYANFFTIYVTVHYFTEQILNKSSNCTYLLLSKCKYHFVDLSCLTPEDELVVFISLSNNSRKSASKFKQQFGSVKAMWIKAK